MRSAQSISVERTSMASEGFLVSYRKRNTLAVAQYLMKRSFHPLFSGMHYLRPVDFLRKRDSISH